MRSIKQKLSFLLVLALLVNLLLPSMGAFAAKSTNDFVVANSGEQMLISPDASNWKNKTITQQSNATPIVDISTNYSVNEVVYEDDSIEPQNIVYVLAAVVTATGPAIQRVAATATQNYRIFLRPFISSNYRENLIRLTGGNPGTIYQSHHMLPQAFQNQYWSRVSGLNIHNPKYLTWVHSTRHSQINTPYNNDWLVWLQQRFSTGIPSISEIETKAADLARKYTLPQYLDEVIPN